MENNLFNQALLKKYAKDKKFTLTVPKYDFLKKHAEKVQEGDFKSEVSSYLYFYDFLKEILGYDREENILFDEKEDSGRGKSEFALKSGDKKFMVIELKDQTTDLDKPQKRVSDRRTPVDQAFDYAQHSGDIKKLLKKLEKYYELDLDDFLDEVRKKKVDVKARKNYQTLKSEFEDSLAVVLPLLREIQETDDEIDRMVYELYGLNEEEIGIVEDI